MKPYFRLILTILLCALLPALASAGEVRFANVGIDGASSVCSMGQDKYGMVWLGTDCGLYSYDGYRAVARYRKGEAGNARIYSLCIEADRIYLGTDHGVLVYGIREGRYLAAPAGNVREVRAIASWKGHIWLGTATGLYRFSPNDQSLKPVASSLHNVYSLLADGQRMLVGTISGLASVDVRGHSTAISMPGSHPTLVNALQADTVNHCVWVGTEGAMYCYRGKNFEPIGPLQGNSVKSFAVAGSNVYAGTDNGLYIYSPSTRAVSHATHDSREPRSIANNIVWTLMADRWGNLWAGTDQALSMLTRQHQMVEVPLADITGNGDGNCLHAIFRDAAGTMWLGGTNGLIACAPNADLLGGSQAQVRWYRPNSPTYAFSHNRVRRIVNDADGHLLVCTDHGINIYNAATRQFRNVVVTDRSGRYTTAWAYDIVDDRHGHYWIASYMGGVFVVAKERLLAAQGTVVADRHLARQLQGLHVWQLALDGHCRVWASMYDNGLDCIDPQTMRVTHMIGKRTHVNYIIPDSHGNIWAATESDVRCFGLNARDNRTVEIDGPADCGVAMLANVEGCIWAFRGRQCSIVGTDGTTACFAVKGFTPLAMWYDRATRHVILGGNDRLVALSAAAAKGTNVQPRLMLSAIEVDGNTLQPDKGSASFASDITLTHRQNNISFLFTDMPMQGSLPRVYAYLLEGADRTWQYIDATNMQIGYNSLPPGRYTLRVRMVDGEGNASAEAFTLGVRILPPWYLSVWMRIVYWLIIAALLWWAAKFYVMRSRLREERAAKERILQQSASRQSFFDNLSRQLKSPLGRIFASVLQMLHGEADTSRINRLEQMRHDVVAINRLIGECLDVQPATAASHHAADKASIDVVDFWRRATADARLTHGRGAVVEFRTDVPSAYVSTDVARLQAVAERLLAMSASHSEGSEPLVAVTSGRALTTVSITMPGVNVSEGDLPFIFNRYFASSADDASAPTPFAALADAKDFADADGATISATAPDGMLIVAIAFVTPTAKAPSSAPADAPAAEPESQDARLLAKITAAVETHIADSDFNVTRLQEAMGLGSKLLYRKVKQMTGKTPVEFIRHIRMQHAAVLLREGKFSVSEVMYMVGYSNSSYFSKCFQKAYGIAPADYSRKSTTGQGNGI